jgi:hypothetical protein
LFVDYTTSNVVQRTLARGAIASGLTYTGDGSIIAGGPAQHDYMQYYQKYMKSNHIFDGAGAGATADTRGPSEDAGKGLKGGGDGDDDYVFAGSRNFKGKGVRAVCAYGSDDVVIVDEGGATTRAMHDGAGPSGKGLKGDGYCDDDYVRTGAGSRSFKGKGGRESFSTVCAYGSDDVVIDEGGTITRATQTGKDGGVDDDEYVGSGSGSGLIDTLGDAAHEQPCLHLHADQCSVGAQTVLYLNSRIRSTAQPDCFHRLWNDCQDRGCLGPECALRDERGAPFGGAPDPPIPRGPLPPPSFPGSSGVATLRTRGVWVLGIPPPRSPTVPQFTFKGVPNRTA